MGAYDVYGISELTLEQGVYCGSPPPTRLVCTTYTIAVSGDEPGIPWRVHTLTFDWDPDEPMPTRVTATDDLDNPVPLPDDTMPAVHALFQRVMGIDGY